MNRRLESPNRGARSPRSDERSDEDLILALGGGSLEELGILFDRHSASVRSYFARMGTPMSEIDDLVQTTFLEVVRAASRFDRNRASARSWLFGVATIMLRRSRRTIATTFARAALWVGFAHQEPITPSEAFENDEMAERLALALQRMSAKKREAFVLVSIEGFSGEEAARVLGVPVKTVWTRLHHARAELHRAFDGEEGGDL